MASCKDCAHYELCVQEKENVLQITQDKFDEILKKHELWLKGEKGGECANFENADLTNIDLSTEKIKCVDFSKAKFINADLNYARFEECKFDCTNFSFSDLEQALFKNCDMREAVFDGADLTCTEFDNCDLRYSDYSNAYIDSTCMETSDILYSEIAVGSVMHAQFSENQIKQMLDGIIYSGLRSRSTSLDFRDKLKEAIKIFNLEQVIE